MRCIICDKEAKKRLSPDMDIKGIGFCEEHETDVILAYWVLMNEGTEAYEKIINKLRKKKGG